VAVIATDGVNTVRSESKSFSVNVKPCLALILAPADGTVIAQDEWITFRGQGFLLEENRPETEALVWRSSKDGELGRGMVLMRRRLTLGLHEIMLMAGTGKRAGRASISVQVRGGTK
jgi:hypothetical protein